jgi:hypothetical protein
MNLIVIVVIVNIVLKMIRGKARGKGKNTAGMFFSKGLSKFAFMLVAYFVFVVLYTF